MARGDAELARRRAAIDRLNRDILRLVQRRTRLALAIVRWKSVRGLPAVDAARERALVDDALRAPGSGLDREAVRRLCRALLRETRARVRAASRGNRP